MCGIAGFWLTKPSTNLRALERMLSSINHRGPDSMGISGLDPHGPTLGHRRLSIVDLSDAGAQPMASLSGRYTIVLNGEIYNHEQLRSALVRESKTPISWRGHSDTEVLLEAIEHWGLEHALSRAAGMFAFAVWDRSSRLLHLSRDRMGEKPLYWAQNSAGLFFGSELKALIASRALELRISPDAVASLLLRNNIPAPATIFEGVSKLEAGKILTIESPTSAPKITSYWSIAEAWRVGLEERLSLSDADAISGLERVLLDTIRGQMQADVPLGAFLSGGVDSSAVVALMQSLSMKKVKTFTIGFPVEGYNEAESARAVAEHLGTEHTELYLTPTDCLGVVDELPFVYCEPFADSSQIPTILVSRLARKSVTVALSGDGGDELFCGYNRYLFAPGLQNRFSSVPPALKAMAANIVDWLSPAFLDSLGKLAGSLISSNARFSDFGDKVKKAAVALRAPNDEALYRGLIAHWHDPELVVPSGKQSEFNSLWRDTAFQSLRLEEKLMAADASDYLPNDILTKVDRASMASSLEARAPFLDHRLYEYLARMPLELKLRGGTTKWLLRQVLYKHVPKSLIERPKVGFGVPIEHWLRNELRDWAEDLLSTSSLAKSSILNPIVVRKAWAEHLSGRQNHQHRLWCILMFQSWHKRWATEFGSPNDGVSAPG